ncbi:MAG: efflux RND transporter permease subunit [Clostridium sp.]|nr:efflux RND transporter permease subunit [Clostridium sp.]
MGLTKLVLRRPVTTFLVVLCLIVFGSSSLLSSKLELTPDMELPMMVVYAMYPGAAPEDVSELVTKPIEDNLSTLNNVKQTTSYSMENVSFVLLQYEYGTNMDKAYTDLKKSMDIVKATLPDDVETPTIVEFDINSMASLTIAVNNDAASNLYNYVNDNIVPEIEKLGSVASVDVSGGREEYIKVEVIPEKLAQYHLSISSVANAVATADLSYPAGTVKVGNQKLSVSTGVDFDDMESLKQIPITLASGDVIYLQDVANVNTSLKEAAGIGRYNGQDTIALGIHMQDSSSASELSRDVLRTIDRLKEDNENLKAVVVYDSSDSINSALGTVMKTMVAAVIISMIIIFLFFGDIKASMIVGTSIPFSILTALIAMSAMGFSLNVVTLGALVLGVGMMVDNSIVVLESCFRATEGKGFAEFHSAALEGSAIVLASIIGSTITTCVVFLPLAMMQGLSGQLFKPLGFTIVFCMLASLVSAMTLVPLCYTLYRPTEKTTAPLSGIVAEMQKDYRWLMKKILPRTKTVMIVTLLLLLVSFGLATQVRTELMPETDGGQIQVTVGLRPGITVDAANGVLEQVEEFVREDEDVESYMLSYGSTGLSVSQGSDATLTAYLKDKRKRTTKDIINEWKPVLTALPDSNISLKMASDTQMSSYSTNDVEYILKGTQYDDLKRVSGEVTEALKARPEVTKIHSTLENSAPVIQIAVDPLKAQAEGLTAAQVGGTVNMMLSGKEATTLDVNGEDISVMVEYADDEYDTIDKVRGIVLQSPAGTSVALTDIADIYFKDSPTYIIRDDREYRVTISGSFTDAVSEKEKKMLEDRIYEETVVPNLTAGISRSTNQQVQMQNEEFSSLGNAILTAIFLVFVVMAAQFESPKFSFMVMTTIPFSLIGVFGALFLFDVSISMTSLLGFLMLVGTVVNAGILYVDTANLYKNTMDVDTALIEAGATRLRPILMTTLTTVLSMVPMALGLGRSGEVMQGLAMVNVGGLFASTVLSLMMLPVYYKLMNRGKKEEIPDLD